MKELELKVYPINISRVFDAQYFRVSVDYRR